MSVKDSLDAGDGRPGGPGAGVGGRGIRAVGGGGPRETTRRAPAVDVHRLALGRVPEPRLPEHRRLAHRDRDREPDPSTRYLLPDRRPGPRGHAVPDGVYPRP